MAHPLGNPTLAPGTGARRSSPRARDSRGHDRPTRVVTRVAGPASVGYGGAPDMIIGEAVPDQLTIDQAAALLGTHRQTVTRWSKLLSFPIRRDRAGAYVNADELRAWVELWGHNSAGVALR